MGTVMPILLIIACMTAVIACNKGYAGGWGWGEPVIVLPKPTLLPKLKAAFIDGKLSVNYHKIVGPSLKPLPFKKGIGWIHKQPHGWGHHGWGHGWGHELNGIGLDHHIPLGLGKTGYLGVSYGKGWGYGKGVGVGWGKGIDVIGAGLKGHHHHHGYIPPHGHHLPVEAKLPIPHHGHIGHTVTQHDSVTVVDKGLPHVGIPHGPIGNELYGKK